MAYHTPLLENILHLLSSTFEIELCAHFQNFFLAGYLHAVHAFIVGIKSCWRNYFKKYNGHGKYRCFDTEYSVWYSSRLLPSWISPLIKRQLFTIWSKNNSPLGKQIKKITSNSLFSASQKLTKNSSVKSVLFSLYKNLYKKSSVSHLKQYLKRHVFSYKKYTSHSILLPLSVTSFKD